MSTDTTVNTTPAAESTPEQSTAAGPSCALVPGSEVRTFACNHVFKFRKPVCPYCGGKISANVTEWTREKEEGAPWLASEVSVDCDTEPDIDGPEWEGWWESHSADYCDGWRQLADQIVAWMRKHARFDLQNK